MKDIMVLSQTRIELKKKYNGFFDCICNELVSTLSLKWLKVEDKYAFVSDTGSYNDLLDNVLYDEVFPTGF